MNLSTRLKVKSLQKNADFYRLRKQGARFAQNPLQFFFMQTPSRTGRPSAIELGVSIVGIKSAVLRNWLKRRIKAHYTKLLLLSCEKTNLAPFSLLIAYRNFEKTPDKVKLKADFLSALAHTEKQTAVVTWFQRQRQNSLASPKAN